MYKPLFFFDISLVSDRTFERNLLKNRLISPEIKLFDLFQSDFLVEVIEIENDF